MGIFSERRASVLACSVATFTPAFFTSFHEQARTLALRHPTLPQLRPFTQYPAPGINSPDIGLDRVGEIAMFRGFM
jgi:hypothetical protein